MVHWKEIGKMSNNMYKDSKKQWNINDDYIAGFFDGEGCITIKVSTDKRKKHNTFIGGKIDIVQTNLEILEEIKKVLAYGYIGKRKKKNKNHNDIWYFQVQAEKDLRNFIKRFENKIIIKKRQLNILLNFFNIRKKITDGKYRPKNILKLLEFAKNMQIANSSKITENLRKTIEKMKNEQEREYV